MNDQPLDLYAAFRYGSDDQLRDALAQHGVTLPTPKRRRTWPLLLIIIAGLAVMLAAVCLAPKVEAVSSANRLPIPASMNQPCPQEDSVNCYWDAQSAGNHRGHSFIVRQFPGRAHMVCVMYENAKDAHRWDYCEGDDAIYVYLDKSDQPTRVFREDVSRVHLRHGVCVATVVGYDRWVELANTNQYPSRCAVPRHPTCSSIDGSEFPRKAARVEAICRRNVEHGAHWQHVGRYDGQRHVWRIVGPTTVYVTPRGWFETS